MSGKLYGIQHGRLLQVELDWAKCGTTANYRGHLRRGEKACEACRQANLRRNRDRYSTQVRAQRWQEKRS
jgi:hypothetical protein